MADILQGCVLSLRSTQTLLDSCIQTLDAGVADYPRLAKVLHSTRHFELISEPDLHAAQAALHSEIRPEVDGLLARVGNHLDRLERREQSLIAKAELQDGRLSQGGGRGSRETARPGSAMGTGTGVGRKKSVGPTSLEGLKMQALRNKKERLSYAVDRLNLQAQQQERRLRLSMPAPVD